MKLTPFATLAVVSVAACSRDRQNAVDPALAADLQAVSGGSSSSSLELAPASNKSQVVVSAIEGGPTSAPKRASTRPVYHPTQRPAPRVATTRQVVNAPAPVEAAPVEAPAPQPVEQIRQVQQAPAPAPAPTQRQPGVYKTEAEVFSKMPWIKP